MEALSLSAFADKLNNVLPFVMKEFARKMAALNGAITLPQFLVMEHLARNGQAKMKALADFMRVSTPAMTGIVARLVRQGLVHRVYDPQDRRIIKVKLDPKGETLVKKIHAQRREAVIRAFGRLPEADRQDYLRILMQIKSALEKEDR